MSDFTHRFDECGNGFPQDGDDVLVHDGMGDYTVMRVVRTSPIHTAQFQSNYIYLELAESDADYDDLSDADADEMNVVTEIENDHA